MRGRYNHAHSQSETVNQRAQLAKAYQDLGNELSSGKIRVVGNYTLGKVIGEGTYGTVRLGTHRLTGTRVAIKEIPKEVSAQLTREIHHHRRLHHPHVTQLYEVIATESSIWLVTELCSGGELYDYLVEKGRLNEDETRRLVGQLCLALHYVHNSKAVHRDLKLENVLLDERCNVKIGDFGFTREWESGRMLETFCGTPGYAAPEMLLGEKYSGPEVDIWSVGIILYCLLTGTLPFDEENEEDMKVKIVAVEYEDPEWLSNNARDLIGGILKRKASDRLTIPQILSHRWFTQADLPDDPPFFDLSSDLPQTPNDPLTITTNETIPPIIDRVSTPDQTSSVSDAPYTSESSSAASEGTHPSTSDLALSDLTTLTTPDDALPSLTDDNTTPHPDDDEDGLISPLPPHGVYRSWSESTLGKRASGPTSSKISLVSKHSDAVSFAAVPEEGTDGTAPSLSRSNSTRKAPPSAYPTRTPVRTKRRSVTSNLSAPSSPTEPVPSPAPDIRSPTDYAGMLAASSPVIFTTPLERELLNSLSMLGFDTGQIVHSVLTDACDAAGAIWWILKRKAEKREALEARRVVEERRKTLAALDDKSRWSAELNRQPTRVSVDDLKQAGVPTDVFTALPEAPSSTHSKSKKRDVSPPLPPLPPESLQPSISLRPSAVAPPSIGFVPPTPVFDNFDTNPSQNTFAPTGSSSPFNLGPDGIISDPAGSTASSTPTTPSREKVGKHGKPRSGSVSMLQRAAGALVRKKSEGNVREEATAAAAAEAARLSQSTSSRPSDASGGAAPSLTSSASPALSHSGSFNFGSSHKLTKSPATSHKGKERELLVEETPRIASVLTPGSPWNVTTAPSTTTPSLHSKPSFKFMQPSFMSSSSLGTHDESRGGSSTTVGGSDVPTVSEEGGSQSKGRGNRSSLLTTFRGWFHEDKEKKKTKTKKPAALPLSNPPSSYHGASFAMTPNSARSGASGYRVGAGSMKKKGARRHDKRPSVSSRRSSSVNSRRSSVASLQAKRPDYISQHYPSNEAIPITRQVSDASHRSFGSRTPNSERDSRPSSIRSFSITPMNHRSNYHRARSPSQSSMSSAHHRATSPLHHMHRRGGSGSSHRVRKHFVHHHRTGSAASSTHSRSRPSSLHEDVSISEIELANRGSPSRPSRTPITTTTVFSHHQGSLFGGPMATRSLGRSSWKKAWGVEPPSWQSRASHAAVLELETLSDPGHGQHVRDVFSGRQSLDPNDEDNWEDMDDEAGFVGGLGQMPSLALPPITTNFKGGSSANGLPPSPSLVTKKELPMVGGRNRQSNNATSKRSRPTSAPLFVSEPLPRNNFRPSPSTPSMSSVTEHPGGGSSPPDPHHPSRTRRQPAGRGPSFGDHPIQEEDEDEEEE